MEFHSNYSTIKEETLAIVLSMTKFQDDLVNKEFLLRVDCKSSKQILQKDVRNIVSKQIFARWQALSTSLDFQIDLLKVKIILYQIFLPENSCSVNMSRTRISLIEGKQQARPNTSGQTEHQAYLQ